MLETSSVEIKNKIQEEVSTRPDILDELSLDKALKLARKKLKDGRGQEAKAIYEDILTKFPKNNKALDEVKR